MKLVFFGQNQHIFSPENLLLDPKIQILTFSTHWGNAFLCQFSSCDYKEVYKHIRDRDVLFMALHAADPSGLTLQAGCQVVVDPPLKSRNCLREHPWRPPCLCEHAMSPGCIKQSHIQCIGVCTRGRSCDAVCASVRYDQYQVQTERHKDQWAVIMKSRPLMIISKLLMNLECHVC